MDNKLIAEALLEIATERGETTFIEAADKEIIEAAKRMKIVIPSPDLAVIKTIYAEIDKPNRNGVILPKEAVVKGLPTLIGKQINWEHDGAGKICGYIIDAKIKNDKIEIIGVIFKSLFPEEMAKVKERFKEKKLAVSFEIWSKNPETGESSIHNSGHKYVNIDPIIFHGCGLLTDHKPACPKAVVYKLVANNEIQNAEQIVEKVFSNDLIFASLAIEKPKCKNCKTCDCKEEGRKLDIYELMVAEAMIEITEDEITSFEIDYTDDFKEAKKMTYQEKKGLSDSDFAVIVTVKNKITGEPRKIRMFPIHDEAHVRNALARLGQEKVRQTLKSLGVSVDTVEKKILKRAKELNMTELLKRYEKANELYEGSTEVEEAKRLTYQEEQNLPDSDFALIQEVDGKKVRRFPIPDEAHVRNALARLPQAKDLTEEEKNTALKNILKRAKKLDMTELLKKYEKAEETPKTEETTTETKVAEIPATAETKVEDALKVEETQKAQSEVPVTPVTLLRTVTEETVTTVYTPDEKGSTTSRKGNRRETREFSDGTKSVAENEYNIVDSYTQAQLEEKTQVAVDELVASLPPEVTTCVKGKIKDGMKPAQAVKECWSEYKDKQSKAMAEEVGKKETEITNLKTELGLKDQEIATLKPKEESKVEKVEAVEMEVGAVDAPADKLSETKIRAKQIDEIIARKHQR